MNSTTLCNSEGSMTTEDQSQSTCYVKTISQAVHRWPWRADTYHSERCVWECISVQASAGRGCWGLSSRRAEVLLRAVCAVQRDCVLAALCVQQSVQQSVQGSWQVWAGTRDSSCSCGQHTEATARGASAQRHRSASPVEEKPASRKTMAPQQHIAPSSRCCPGRDAVSL